MTTITTMIFMITMMTEGILMTIEGGMTRGDEMMMMKTSMKTMEKEE